MSENTELPELLTPRQVTELLHIHASTLRRWEREGQIKAVWVEPGTKTHYYLRGHIQSLLERLPSVSKLNRLNSQDLLRQLARLLRTVSSNLDAQAMAQTVVNEAVNILGSDRSSIYLLSPTKSHLIPFVAVDAHNPASIELFFRHTLAMAEQPQLAQLLFANDEVTYVYDTYNDPRTTREFFEKFQTRAIIMAPLKASNGELRGFLDFSWTGKPRLFTDEELIFADALASQASIALENARLLELQYNRSAELETVLDTITDGVSVFDQDLHLLWANKAARKVVGVSLPVQVTPTAKILAQFKVRRLDGSPLLLQESPIYRAVILGETVTDFEAFVVGENGEHTVVNVSAAPFFDSQGALRGGVLAFHNVTVQYQIKEQLRQLSEEAQANAAKLSAIIESAAQPIVVYDNTSRVILANQKLAELYGIPRSEIEGLNSTEFMAKIVAKHTPVSDMTEVMRRVTQNDLKSYTEEIEFSAPQSLIVQRLVTPVLDEQGRTLGKVALYRDVTAERALDRAKDEFIALATHELRTPLTTISGYAQLLLNRLERLTMAEKTAEAVLSPVNRTSFTPLFDNARQIQQQAGRLEELINDLLDISRLTSGRLEMQRRPFDIISLVRQAVEQIQVTTTNHELKLEIVELENEGNVKSYLVGDAKRIEQVVRNLLENAVKYTPAGGVIRVTVSYKTELEIGQPSPSNSAYVQVAVQDQGIGISPAHQVHLFERFFRASNAVVVASGLGLGLSICAEIVRQHQGRIWVESPGENMGSTFIFKLPIEKH